MYEQHLHCGNSRNPRKRSQKLDGQIRRDITIANHGVTSALGVISDQNSGQLNLLAGYAGRFVIRTDTFPFAHFARSATWPLVFSAASL